MLNTRGKETSFARGRVTLVSVLNARWDMTFERVSCTAVSAAILNSDELAALVRKRIIIVAHIHYGRLNHIHFISMIAWYLIAVITTMHTIKGVIYELYPLYTKIRCAIYSAAGHTLISWLTYLSYCKNVYHTVRRDCIAVPDWVTRYDMNYT